MIELVALLPNWLQPEYIIESLGTWALVGVVLIIFAECGLLIGFFLPGDSLLFVTGLFIANGAIPQPIWLAVVLLCAAAVLGNLCGYRIGYAIGPKLFDKPDSRFFKREYVDKTHNFFEKYGSRAVVLARFVPIVRTFITAIAGVGRMDFRTYGIYSTIGGVIWAGGITLLGYFLGGVAWIENNLELTLIIIVLISIIPILIEYLRHRNDSPEQAVDEIVEEGY